MTTTRDCWFSSDRKYRYKLDIIWDPSIPPQVFIGLNPSTADENNDDPTVRRCIDYAKRWGAGGLRMLNAFAYRSTDWKALKTVESPFCHPDDSDHYRPWYLCKWNTFNRPIAAWGKHVEDVSRGYNEALLKSFQSEGINLSYLKMNKDGTPSHPLYLKSNLIPLDLDTNMR